MIARWLVVGVETRIVGLVKTFRFAKGVGCMGMTGRIVLRQESRDSTPPDIGV
jgi:hypothetical protein